MKPKQLLFYETSAGQPVKTIDEWKRVEVRSLLTGWKDAHADQMINNCFNTLVDELLNHSEELVGILSVSECGRPNGAKDKKPRVKKTAKRTVIPTKAA